MEQEYLRYDHMVDAALRGVVRDSLRQAAEHGLQGDHHFYIGFDTTHEGVEIPGTLRAQYPEEMTIVLQHRFWDLDVDDEGFGVTLTFGGNPARLVVPYSAITSFNDPSANFGLQFSALQEHLDHEHGVADAGEEHAPGPPDPETEPAAAQAEADDSGKVVTLDAFRKKS